MSVSRPRALHVAFFFSPDAYLELAFRSWCNSYELSPCFIGKPVVLGLSSLDLVRSRARISPGASKRATFACMVEGVDPGRLSIVMRPLLGDRRQCAVQEIAVRCIPRAAKCSRSTIC